MENKLFIALGLINGSLHIEKMEEFDKVGLISNLKKVQSILEEF